MVCLDLCCVKVKVLVLVLVLGELIEADEQEGCTRRD